MDKNIEKANCKGTFIGSSGIGKTTLLTAMYREMKDALNEEMGITCAPDPKSEGAQILYENYEQIQSIFEYAEFDADVLKGTSESTYFNIQITANNTNLNVAILDYPGGDLGKNDAIDDWIAQSSFLIVPLDATLLMEAGNAQQSAKTKKAHNITKIKEIIVKWTNNLLEKKENGLLIFAPLKCETYFNDNPEIPNRHKNEKEKGNMLKKKINKLFAKDVLAQTNHFMKISKTLEIKYIPIDTLGSVFVKGVDWEEVRSSFMIDREAGARYMPSGGKELLVEILKFNMEKRKSLLGFFTGRNKKLNNAIKKLQQEPTKRLTDWT